MRIQLLSMLIGPLVAFVSSAALAPTNAAEPAKSPELRASTLSVGQVAPAITLEGLLQAPDGQAATWEIFTNKVVVIDFWATWCAPCVQAIPHLNQLVDTFAAEPVVFLSVTREELGVVEEFLPKHPLKSWVGIDADSSMWVEYDVPYIPFGVVVGRDGKVAHTLQPEQLEAAEIWRLLGKPVVGSGPRIPQFTVVPSQSGESEITFIDGMFQARGASLIAVLSLAFDVDMSRIEGLELVPEGLYDVRFDAPDRKPDLALLKQGMRENFGIEVASETRATEVFLLTSARAWTAKASSGSTARVHQSPGSINADFVDLDTFCAALSDELQRPVVNTTAIKGRYDLALSWDSQKAGALQEVLSSKFGLKLTEASRPLKYVVVTAPADQAAATEP